MTSLTRGPGLRRPPRPLPPRRPPPPRADHPMPPTPATGPTVCEPRRSPAGWPASPRLDLRALTGSGPGGRIVKADLERARQPVAPTAATPQAGGAKGVVTIVQPSRTQVQIAQRMAESKATIPDFTLHAEADMAQAVELRAQLRRAARGGDAVPSYNDMVVKACALALRDHPRANAAYRDGAFELYERVNVGIAVAAEDSLIVPDRVRRRSQVAARDRRRGADARRARPLAPRHAGRAVRRDVHGVEPRDVRRGQLRGDHQPAAGRDPRGRGGARGPGRSATGRWFPARV